MDRAFSTFALKQLDEEKREFSGLATSPVPDRVADIIEPLGVKYQNPTVLLRAHDHTMPIGSVTFDRPTKTGVGFHARIPKIDEPGLLKDRVDMAWGEVRHGLIRAVSVGFRPLEAPEPISGGGVRFPKTEIFELSTVAVPAQELATIDHVKAIDAAVRRGEVPAPSRSSLWGKISAAGQEAMDEFDLSEVAKQANGAFGTAASAGLMSIAMCRALAMHIDDLERRFAGNEIKYLGVWKADRSYPIGCFVTHGGSMWHCDKATDLKPGEGGGWTLAVKKGVDSK